MCTKCAISSKVWILFHNAVFMALADVNKKEMCQLKKVYFNTFRTITIVYNHSCLALLTQLLPIAMVGKLLVGINGLSAFYV